MNGMGMGMGAGQRAERYPARRGGQIGRMTRAMVQARASEMGIADICEERCEDFLEEMEEELDLWEPHLGGFEAGTSLELWQINEAPLADAAEGPGTRRAVSVFRFEVGGLEKGRPHVSVYPCVTGREAAWLRRLETGGTKERVREKVKNKMAELMAIAEYIAREQEPYLVYLESARRGREGVKSVGMPELLIKPLKQEDLVMATLEGRKPGTWRSAVSRHLSRMLLDLPGGEGKLTSPSIFLEGNRGNSSGVKDSVLVTLLLEILNSDEYRARKKDRGEDSAQYLMEELSKTVVQSLVGYLEFLYPGRTIETSSESEYDKKGRLKNIGTAIEADNVDEGTGVRRDISISRDALNKLVKPAEALLIEGDRTCS